MPADESGDETCLGGVVHLSRAARLLDDPVVHHHDQIGERHRLLLGVSDVDEADPELALQPSKLSAHANPQERVQGRERLVEQQDPGIGDEGAGERDALLLSAR